LSIPNEFDPDKIKNPVNVEYRDDNTYEYQDLTDNELEKLEIFDNLIKEIRK